MTLRLVLALTAGLLLAPAPAPPRYRQKVKTAAAAAPATVALVRDARVRTAAGDVLIGSANGIVRQAADGTLAPFPPARLLPVDDVRRRR